jgi:hypothetical protein
MKPHERVAEIKSKAELIAFVRALEADLRAKPDTWENVTLDQYLSALANWLEDSDGYYQNQGRAPPTTLSWKDVADMLIAAKTYE